MFLLGKGYNIVLILDGHKIITLYSILCYNISDESLLVHWSFWNDKSIKFCVLNRIKSLDQVCNLFPITLVVSPKQPSFRYKLDLDRSSVCKDKENVQPCVIYGLTYLFNVIVPTEVHI